MQGMAIAKNMIAIRTENLIMLSYKGEPDYWHRARGAGTAPRRVHVPHPSCGKRNRGGR